MKKLFAILFTVILSTSVFAQNTSKFRVATQGAIADDTTYLFNLTDWNKLQFDNLFLSAGAVYQNRFNLSAAFKTGDSTIHAGYAGNLWADSDWSFATLLWGKDKLSLFASYEHENPSSITFNSTTYNGRLYVPTAGIGYNIDDKNAISLFAKYITIVADDTASDLTQIRPTVNYRRYLENSKSKVSYLTFIYSGVFTTVKDNTTDNSDSYSTHTFTPCYNMETKLSDKLKYGLEVDLPVSYRDLPSFKGFVIQSLGIYNGLSFEATDVLALNFGYSLTTPYIYFPSEADIFTGALGNTYSIGFTFKPAENVKIDASTYIWPWAVSIDNIESNYTFNFSVSAKF